MREAFARNLHQEAGAALCVHVDGRIVADLWGGDAAPGRPWQPDTLVTTFSATKGVAATAMLCLHDRGLLDLDAPVADGWPEFAQAGKAAITVRQLLEHKAGLAWVDTPLTLEILADLPRLSAVLAAQAPVLPIGQQAYAATAWGKQAWGGGPSRAA